MMPLPQRIIAILVDSMGLRTLDELCRLTPRYLLTEPGFGPHSLWQVEDVLAIMGRSLQRSSRPKPYASHRGSDLPIGFDPYPPA